MKDVEYKIKRISKRYFILNFSFFSICAGILITIIVLAFTGVFMRNEKQDEYLDIIICGVLSPWLIGIIIYIIKITWNYQYSVDIFYQDKMVRYVGKKIKLTLAFKDILSIEESWPAGIYTVYITCKDQIKLIGGKKGHKTFIEHYKREDVFRIKQIVGNYNYNLITE